MSVTELQIWPVAFPLPKLASYNVMPDNAVLRTQVEGGAARQRNIFTQVPTRVSANFIFDNDNLLDN